MSSCLVFSLISRERSNEISEWKDGPPGLSCPGQVIHAPVSRPNQTIPTVTLISKGLEDRIVVQLKNDLSKSKIYPFSNLTTQEPLFIFWPTIRSKEIFSFIRESEDLSFYRIIFVAFSDYGRLLFYSPTLFFLWSRGNFSRKQFMVTFFYWNFKNVSMTTLSPSLIVY